MFRTLIVDDDPLIREHIQRKIENMNSEFIVCTTLPNGKKALEWLEEHYVDVCVADIQMPRMDGLNLIQEIGRKYPWMANIVISSHNLFDYAQRAIQLGIVDYLLKPIDEKELFDTFSKTKDKIKKARMQAAYKLMFQHLSSCQGLKEQWLETIRMVQYDDVRTLVNDTAGLMKLWVKGEPYLMQEVALSWLEMACTELRLTPTMNNMPDRENAITLRHNDIPSYFYEKTIKILENGLNQMLTEMERKPNYQHSQLVHQVKTFIEEHYANDITLDDIADHLAMSKNHIAKLFKHETGATIWDYVVHLRMEKAKQLLVESQLRSYEIAERVGYKNAIYFAQLFKRTFGMNPMEYKKRLRKASDFGY